MFYQFLKMKKYRIALIFFQILASTIILIKEANAGNYEFSKANSESTEVKDLEMETSKVKDIFPDLLSFATNLYQ